MKYAGISSELSELKKKEKSELVSALKAHGYIYTWFEVDDYEMDYDAYEEYLCGEINIPSVTVVPEYGERSFELAVCEVSANDKGDVVLTGFVIDDSDLDIINCSGDDVMYGHLSFLTDMISGTPDQQSVSQSIEKFPVTCVSRRDLESRGYDTSAISDDTMECIAKHMGTAYCENGFWTDLEITADYLNIPKLEKK